MSLAEHHAPIVCTSSTDLQINERGGLRSKRFDDFYFLPNKGLEESDYVFIQGNQLPTRWQQWFEQDDNSQQYSADHFVIVETGFGTGLNFLLAFAHKCLAILS